MITYKQYNQWQGQYCCMKLENLEIITTDEQRGVLCRCRDCFSAEFYEPRIFKEYAEKEQVEPSVPLNNSFKVPRQEDLQEFIRKFWNIGSENIVDNFCSYVQEGVFGFVSDLSGSMNILWLCFLMDVVYGKRWNEEKLDWEFIKGIRDLEE